MNEKKIIKEKNKGEFVEMTMLEESTKCWICKRTEREIIEEIKKRGYAESIFDEVRKENKEKILKRVETEEGLISIVDVGTLGYMYPLCAFCAGLIYTIGDIAAVDRLNYEKDDGIILSEDTCFTITVD